MGIFNGIPVYGKKAKQRQKIMCKYMKAKLCSYVGKSWLDVGKKNEFTSYINVQLSVPCDNTSGDLDFEFSAPNNKYDVILFSHVIEHLMNPLLTLCRLREFMGSDSVMFVAMPDRGRLLWTRNHFHEIDSYRFVELCKKAQLQVDDRFTFRVYDYWWYYFRGFRPLWRLFRERSVVYMVTKDGSTS
ncbi:MAG: methyltransferase domain-containing protein [Candidatus Peribacteraceae bacterium]|nr:methyltransferase domain-containing protein [Candidatus Peribacteraceae bacterium]